MRGLPRQISHFLTRIKNQKTFLKKCENVFQRECNCSFYERCAIKKAVLLRVLYNRFKMNHTHFLFCNMIMNWCSKNSVMLKKNVLPI
jgi:hypothetical protein